MALHHQHQFSVAQAGKLTLAAVASQKSIDPAQPPILCLHGWLDNAASFIPLAAELADYELLALDFPGHGLSAHRSADAHYHFVDWVADIALLCQQQGWQHLTVIGHSMGGMVATALAASFPELVKKLILIDSLGFITNEADDCPQQLRLGIESRHRLTHSRKPRYQSVQQAAEARQKQSDFSLTEALLLAQRGTEPCNGGFTWRSDLRLRQQSLYRFSPAQAEALISALACPVTAIMASDGPFLEKARAVIPHYKQLQLHTVSGGHHCHMTNAPSVANFVRQSLT